MFLKYLDTLITVAARLMSFAILARVIMSWMRVSPMSNRFTQVIYEVTEPILAFLKRYIPPIGGTIDITPIVAFFIIDIIHALLLLLIYRL